MLKDLEKRMYSFAAKDIISEIMVIPKHFKEKMIQPFYEKSRILGNYIKQQIVSRSGLIFIGAGAAVITYSHYHVADVGARITGDIIGLMILGTGTGLYVLQGIDADFRKRLNSP